MKRRNLVRAAGITIGCVAAALAVAPATAAPTAAVSPHVLSALQRDLGLSADQVQTRLAQEAAARTVRGAAQAAAGDAFGGAWFDPALGKLVVGVTDAARADAVRATGAAVTTVGHTEAALTAAKSALDAHAAPKAVTGWYVDVKSSSVVVKVQRAAQGADLDSFLAFARSAGPVRVETAANAPRVLAGDIVGGDAYHIGGTSRCSVGFSVADGFVSAGHCGQPGDSVEGDGYSGQFEGSEFPGGGDYSYVKADGNPTPKVNGYGNPDVTVAGSDEAGVGASVCRSGSTSGWHCGTIQATDQTVNYPEGTVTGLTQTNACAEPGDSGGSWVSGSQAQGVTSGGSGDCSSGGETFFQPVNEILSAYSLKLVTG
ncbi:S1 family peptidase [Amycolatopsis anabasis]|uniref:S1 family peptidase n=1 Tax=Amycolatopsis anabasis TaxID=1840409 RepID=UPI00131EC072|nr:S1 family peptidase [Amycolatopsis anabasis]